jgi:glycine cleavage system H protein
MRRVYTDTHEWLELDGQTARVGISRFAQQELGEIVFVGLPEVGQSVAAGEELCVLESLKAAAEVYAPVALTVLECNVALHEHPSLLNQDPEQAGWLVRVRLHEPLGAEHLLEPERYQALLS